MVDSSAEKAGAALAVEKLTALRTSDGLRKAFFLEAIVLLENPVLALFFSKMSDRELQRSWLSLKLGRQEEELFTVECPGSDNN